LELKNRKAPRVYCFYKEMHEINRERLEVDEKLREGNTSNEMIINYSGCLIKKKSLPWIRV